jgi:hypothetical protein
LTLIMISWVLRVLAVWVGLLILLVVFIRLTSIGIGIRTSQNTFAGQIGNITISTWLLIIFLLIEAILLLFIFLFRNSA